MKYMKKCFKNIKFSRGIMLFIMLIFAACCIVPFLIILGSSFQSQKEILNSGYSMIPKKATVSAYKYILSNPKSILNAYWITILTSFITTVMGVLLSASYGYVISRKEYRYKKSLSFFIFFTMLFNGGLVPTYILISKWLNLSDTIWALILPSLASPWYILMLKGFFQTLPSSLIEAAKIDGAGELKIFSTIIIPISKPALATIALFYLLGSWNDWWLSMLYIEKDSLVKLQYLLQRILKNIDFLNSEAAVKYSMVGSGTEIPTYSARMAMCVLATGPILMVFPFFQKHFVKGLTVGSVKG